MNQIYIVGAGGLGREVYTLIEEINKVNKIFNLMGFLDADPSKKTVTIGKKIIPVFEEKLFLEQNSNNPQIHLVIAIGTPDSIYKIANYYKENTLFQFPNLLHPSVQYTVDAIKLQEGNIIASNTFLSIDVNIGSFNIINLHCTVGHDTQIGSFNVINPGVNLSGGITLGNQNLLGTNATILQNLSIGNSNTISAASFISKSIDNGQILIGNPARVIGLNN